MERRTTQDTRKTVPAPPRRAPSRKNQPLPFTTVDVVIFTERGKGLEVLLVRRPLGAGEPFPGCRALPGGFVDTARDADLAGCARRTLEEKTGVRGAYLEQLGSWGSATRDPRGWSATHVYFALVAADGVELRSGRNASDVDWCPIDDRRLRREGLAFDHATILAAAIDRLRNKVEYTSLPAFLVEEPFTLPQLQRVYEAVLGRPLDKSAFRTRMLDAGFLEETGFVDGSSARPAMGYRIVDRAAPVVFPRTFKATESAGPRRRT